LKLEGEQALLRLHVSNFVKWHGRPLYEAIVEKGRRERLSGATVLTGLAGFIGVGPLLGPHLFALREERPMVVEFVDRTETLDRFLDTVTPMLVGQPVIVTLERAHVVHYGGGSK
jgi:PII-like signaling protein